MKRLFLILLLTFILVIPAFAAPPAPIPPIRQLDCSGVIGKGTLCYDTDNDKFYIGNGTSAVEIGSGDVISVGDCASGACLDGTSDGGTYISFYDGNSNKTTIQAGNSTIDLSFTFPTTFPPNDGDMLTSGLTGAFGYLPQSTFASAGHTHAQLHDQAHNTASADHADWPAGLDVTELSYVNGVTSAIQTQLDSKAAATIYEIDSIPVGWFTDGTTAPGALSTLASTNKAKYRDFSGAANNDVFVEWIVPYGMTGTVQFQVEGWITNATAPANGETIKFVLSGVSIGHSELLSSAQGTAVTVTFTADATLAQYDRVITGYSSAVTISGLSAGEIVVFALSRDVTDTYGQVFGVGWLKIKYSKTLQTS